MMYDFSDFTGHFNHCSIMVILRVISTIAAIVIWNCKPCFSKCGKTEYEMNGQCCSMCAPGNSVYWHCSEDANTTCAPCPASTYTDEPNRLITCLPCTVCEESRGLRVNKACTQSSDSVCGPLERFYCIDKMKCSCILAVQHSECSPGKYIKQAGTASTDIVCADCTGDTYSNGSFSSCLPHTKCEDMGLTETNPGTYSSDTECGNRHTAVAIISLTVVVIVILIVFPFIFILKKKQSQKSGTQKTEKYLNEKASSKVVAGRKNIEADRLEEQALTTVLTQST